MIVSFDYSDTKNDCILSNDYSDTVHFIPIIRLF